MFMQRQTPHSLHPIQLNLCPALTRGGGGQLVSETSPTKVCHTWKEVCIQGLGGDPMDEGLS